MRVLGFPLHVRPGFLLFMLLIVAINGDEFGVWLAISIAGFTLIHELGHAQAARWAGAKAEISLDFLAGYASYEAPHPLRRSTQIGISLAGPVTHIAVSLGVLLAMGVDPLDAYSRGSSPAAAAVWWAGPAIGAFNLLPVLPLDGGNVVTLGLDRVLPGRARLVMVYASIAVSVIAAVLCALSDQWRGLVVFIGFLLVMQLQALFELRARQARSPFDVALDALDAGATDRARRALVNGIRRPAAAPLVPRPVTDAEATRLVDALARPLPVGDPWKEYVLANLLVRARRFDEAARYAADSYGRTPRTLIATTVARAAGALGDDATAVAWLRAAADAGTSSDGLATVIDQAPELSSIRSHPEVIAVRTSLPAG
ncbi:MAG: metalloprotease [Ilumatobacteraceae bacterium]